MFVLGIDPGLSRCGYGVVGLPAASTPPATAARAGTAGRAAVAVSAGVIETDPHAPLPDRLRIIDDELRTLLAEFRPDAVAVERVFFQTNARTAMSVGQVSGLALAAASAFGCEVVEYTSNEVKQAVVGYGGATKAQVQRMVAALLGLSEVPSPPDVADALALALCHFHMVPLQAALATAVAKEGVT